MDLWINLIILGMGWGGCSKKLGMCSPGFQKWGLRNWFFLAWHWGLRNKFSLKLVFQSWAENWDWKCIFFFQKKKTWSLWNWKRAWKKKWWVAGAEKWLVKGVLRVAHPCNTFQCECPVGSVMVLLVQSIGPNIEDEVWFVASGKWLRKCQVLSIGLWLV